MLCLLLAAVLVGCSSSPTRVAMVGQVGAAPDLNPDGSGRPSPVKLRVYQLRADTAFMAADYFAIFDNEKATLEKDLVSRTEYELDPSDYKKLGITVAPDTRFIGVVAAYREIEKARWRALAPIPTGKDEVTIIVTLESMAVSAAVVPGIKK